MARQHLPNMLHNRRIRIHTLCDRDAILLAQRVAEFQPLHHTTESAEVFATPEIDAVMVGTRAEAHAAFILQAAVAGKAIFVEKPMTRTDAETTAVLQAVQNSGIMVGVGFNRRFAPAMTEAKKLLADNRRNRPVNLIYRIVDDHRIRPAYIFDMADGGGHLLQEGCHIFDLLSWLLEEEPVEVYAAGPLETDNAVILKFSAGSLATILCGGKGGLFYPKELLEMFCEGTTIAVDQFYELRCDGAGGTVRRTFPLDPKSGVAPATPSMTAFYEAGFALRPAHDVIDLAEGNRLAQLKPDKGHNAAITAFADCLTTGRPYPADARAGARATICALRAYDSIRLNRPVPIELVP